MIITDEKILRIKSEDVLSSEINDLIKSLEKELYYSALMGRPGVGLAAVQIGIHKKAAIIRINNNGLAVNLINAKIQKGYNQFIMKDEGCLSLDGKLCNTLRYQEVYINNGVEPYSFIATGLMAVAIQHELDHLDGILITDRMLNPIKPRPNDPCICGSNKKYKRCCKLLEQVSK